MVPGTECRRGPPGSDRPSGWTVWLWQTEPDPPNPSVQHGCSGQTPPPDKHPAKESSVKSRVSGF